MPDHPRVQRQILIEDLAIKVCGVKPGTVQQWRYRGSVPHRYRLPIAEAAAAQGRPLPAGDFDGLSVLAFRPGGET